MLRLAEKCMQRLALLFQARCSHSIKSLHTSRGGAAGWGRGMLAASTASSCRPTGQPVPSSHSCLPAAYHPTQHPIYVGGMHTELTADSSIPPLPQDPIYVGGTHRRVRGDAYWELMDEFLTAVRRRYGTSGGQL